MKCPKCYSIKLKINAVMYIEAIMEDDDCIDWEPGNIEWGRDSIGQCRECGFIETLEKFGY